MMRHPMFTHTQDHRRDRRHDDQILHLKVYQVHYGDNDSNLSSKLMQGSSLQTTYEDMSMPLSDQCLDNALKPKKTL